MSPEQARGEGHRVDGRSDLFSLGVVFYELLTAQRPFRGETQEELLEQIITAEARPPRQVDNRIPHELERICLKALAKRACNRYATAEQMALDLQYFLDDAWVQEKSVLRTSVPLSQARALATLAPCDTPRSDPQPIKIVPKGLRSFDGGDADFFLELLPGPRDREGLPDSLRFWKSCIEQTEPDKTFSVGLLYGPSGCGKSSLVKAGLLPRLAPHVIAVYVEAAALETEARLLKGLRSHCPDLPIDRGLSQTVAWLRRGRGIPEGKKILIVLDQFEQWLHAKRGEQSTELVQALRQCDGKRVQCLILVRDDFWLAVSRFMADLEIELLQGRNMALVDLFDAGHARKVLAAFGRAFTALPKQTEALSKEQAAFLDQAISGLSEDGKIISVRLALFAEMVKYKPWTPATLKSVGGMEGVGVRFLDEAFVAAAAPAQHRVHQRAAQAVLKALLPETGSNIKGHIRSYQDLLAASGYAARSRDLDALLRILDSELRLITPTDPGGVAPEGKEVLVNTDERYYQLTHDYLVPSLRDWLSRKQKETRKGRAELRLAERAVVWNAKPENRHLPAWWEWADVRLLTRKIDWTTSQLKMMGQASRYHTVRGSMLVAGLFIATLIGLYVRDQIIEGSNARHAAALVQRLLDAETAQVPAVISEIENYRHWADPLLQNEHGKASDGSRQKLHTGLALLPVDPSRKDYLYERLLDADPHELPVIRDALLANKEGLLDMLWTALKQPAKGQEHRRLRAACALATYDPDGLQWAEVADRVANDFVSVPPVYLERWMDALRPVRAKLVDPLSDIFRNHKREPTERSLSANILAEYAADRPGLLADLLMDAEEKQFAVLYLKLKGHSDPALAPLRAELDKQLAPKWDEPPPDASWKQPDPSLVGKIEAAHGLLADRFALCQTMPLEEFLAVAEGLRQAGYRPVRFRPYTVGNGVQVAAVWSRDGKDWQMAHGLSAEEVAQRDAEVHKASFLPVDVVGYATDDKELYGAVWCKSEPKSMDGAQLAVSLDENQLQLKDDALRKEAFWRATTTLLPRRSREPRYAVIWKKPAGRKPPTSSAAAEKVFVGFEGEYSGEDHLGDVQVDVQVSKAAAPPSMKERFTRELAELLKQPQGKFDDPSARFQRALAYYHLGENEKALADLSWLVEKLPKIANAHQCRAIVQARLGKAKEARDDLAKFNQLETEITPEWRRESSFSPPKMYTEAVVFTLLGEDAEGMKRLEAAVARDSKRAQLLYDAARVYCVASNTVANRNAATAKRYAAEAIGFLKKAVANGYTDYSRMQTDPDLDPLREQPEFQIILSAGKVDRRYIAIWHPGEALTSVEVHGLGPLQHLIRCREWTAQGYRPASLSVAEIQPGQDLVTASVWHRPVVPEGEMEKLAKRQANGSCLFSEIGAPEELFLCSREFWKTSAAARGSV